MIGPLPDGRIPVVLSAHDEDLIAEDAAAILRHAETGAGVSSIAAGLLRTRRIRRHRTVIRAADTDELVSGLNAVAAGEQHPWVAHSSLGTTRRTAFVFPGQGNQWPGMAAEAYRGLDAYRLEADKCAEAFVAAGAPSPVPYLTGSADGDWPRVQVQAAQFTHAVALASVWQSCGLLCDIAVGHSLGEVAAGYVAGAVTLPDAVGVVTARAAVVDRLPGRYGMAVLAVDVDTATSLAATIPGWLEVSVVNSDASTVLSGDADSVAEIVRLTQGRGVFARQIGVDFPAHTTALESVRDELMTLLPDGSFRAAAVEFIGGAHGAVVSADSDFRRYWYENLRNTVRFDRAVATAISRGAGIFVELSAHPALMMPLADLADGASGGDEPAVMVASSRRDEPLVDHLSAAIITAAVADPAYRWTDLVPASVGPPPRGLPNAPMRSTHFWVRPQHPHRSQPESGTQAHIARELWRPRPDAAEAPSRSIAVVTAAGADESVADRVRAGIARHPRARTGTPADAEIVAVIAPASTETDATKAANELGALVDAGLLDYAADTRAQTQWLITAAAERPHPADPPAAPLQAAAAAMHRCIGFEHPETGFGHLDLPDWNVGDDLLDRVVDVVLGDPAEVALRGVAPHQAQCYERTLSFEPSTAQPLPHRALDNIVITGSGAVGLELARHCAAHGARRILLLARREITQEALDTVRRMGTTVLAASCDITDPAAVSTTAAAYADGDASMVIHAAGSAVLGPSAQLTAEDFRTTCAAKVIGAETLLAGWPLRTDCRIVLCSSTAAVWGGHGNAAYSASNRIVDAIAQRLRSEGRDAVSVRSGLWHGAGILADTEIQRALRSGLTQMPPEAAAAAVLSTQGIDPLVFGADLDRLRTFLESQWIRTDLTEADEPSVAAAQTHRTAGDVVRAEVAAALRLSETQIDLGAALIDIGMDSLLALDLRKRLRTATGQSVPLAKILGGISGAELAAILELTQGVESARD